MELNIPIQQGTNTKAVLKLLNPFLNLLTETEISIVSTIIDSGVESLNNRKSRSMLREKLKMGKFTFNNYVQLLKKKGAIVQTSEDLIINPKLIILAKDRSYTINFIENKN